MNADARFLWLAIAEALHADPFPNPRVGALVVLNGELVSVGHHERAGGPHAEVIALARAGRAARNATLYVTLEPCNHHGRTPPCVDAVLRSGIARVVYGCDDPNPFVPGRGAERLRAAGIDVVAAPDDEPFRQLIDEWTRGLRRTRDATPRATVFRR